MLSLTSAHVLILWVLSAEATGDGYQPPDSARYLQSGIVLYEGLQYELALGQLEKARLRSATPGEESAAALAEGVVYADWGKRRKARESFERGFALAPEAALPVDASPGIVALAEQTRTVVKRRLNDLPTPWAWKAPGEACPELERGVERLWPAATRARVFKTLSSGKPPVASVASGLVSRLGAWVDGWLDQQLALCVRRDLHRESAGLMDSRRRCLDRHGDAFIALVESLDSTASPTPDLGTQLADPADCANLREEAPATSAAATQARSLLAKALAQLDVGHLREAEQYHQQAAAAAGAVRSSLLNAELKSCAGKLAKAKKDSRGAVNEFREAVPAAIEAGAPRLAVDSLMALVEIQGLVQRDFSGATRSVQWATRLLQRMPESALLAARVKLAASGVLLEQGRAADALATLRDGLKLLDRCEATPLTTRIRSKFHSRLGASHADLARRVGASEEIAQHHAQAVKHFETAAQLTIEALGPAAPGLERIWSNLAGVLMEATGDYDRAEKLLRDALSLSERLETSERDHVNLAVLYVLTDRLELAEQVLRNSIDFIEQTKGPEHRSIVLSLELMGGVLRRMGKPERAVAFDRRTASIAAQLEAEGHPDAASFRQAAEVSLGLDYADLGDWTKVPAGLQACEQARREENFDADRLLECEVLKFRLAWATGDRARALEGMRRVARAPSHQAPGLVSTFCAKIRREAQAWLASHASP